MLFLVSEETGLLENWAVPSHCHIKKNMPTSWTFMPYLLPILDWRRRIQDFVSALTRLGVVAWAGIARLPSEKINWLCFQYWAVIQVGVAGYES
jgi:hypothetical protein